MDQADRAAVTPLGDLDFAATARAALLRRGTVGKAFECCGERVVELHQFGDAVTGVVKLAFDAYLPAGYRGKVSAGFRVLPGPLKPIRNTNAPVLSAIREAADEYAAAHADEDAPDRAFDVFISHASQDKDEVVRPLAHSLRERGLRVWYDEFELRIGDNLRRKIDRGLSACRFGVVVLSEAFFAKDWPNYELDGLVTRELSGEQQLILPVWHGVTRADVKAYSAPLAMKLARSTSTVPIDTIADEIAAVVLTPNEYRDLA